MTKHSAKPPRNPFTAGGQKALPPKQRMSRCRCCGAMGPAL